MKNFFTKPASPLPLAVLRIGIATILLFQIFSLRTEFLTLYGPEGVIQPTVLKAIDPVAMLSVQSLASVMGFPTDMLLLALQTVEFAAALCLMLGWKTRWSSIATCVIHALLKGQGGPSNYGVNSFVQICLFYLALAPCGGALSIDAWGKPIRSSLSARVVLRLLQIHVCIVYATSGFYKAQGYEWWTGEATWRALNMETFNNFRNYWLAWMPWLSGLFSIGTVLLELCYGAFFWWPKARKIWVLAIISMHVGIAITMGLYTFSATMIVMNVAAFLISAEKKKGKLIVCFDGACKPCRAIIYWAWALNPGTSRLIGNNHQKRASLPRIEPDLEMAVITTEGSLMRGASAFLMMWEAVLHMDGLSKLGRLPLSKWLYAAFARNRWRFGCKSSCRVGANA